MKYWTLAEIKVKVKNDLDIQEETFIRPDELTEYINEAIDEAEAEIHTLYEDYFLTSTSISMVSGQDEFDMPSNIYANKIRRLIYDNTSTVYTVTRIGDWHKFEAKAIADNFKTSDLYQMFVINDTPGQPKIKLIPKSRDTGDYLTLWYLRNANRLVDDTDICDIPEFIQFVFWKVKAMVYSKEGHPNLGDAVMALEQERKRMNGVLAAMVPDAQNEIELETRFYDEMN